MGSTSRVEHLLGWPVRSGVRLLPWSRSTCCLRLTGEFDFARSLLLPRLETVSNPSSTFALLS